MVKNAITKTLGNASYSKERVNAWCAQIIDEVLKDLYTYSLIALTGWHTECIEAVPVQFLC